METKKTEKQETQRCRVNVGITPEMAKQIDDYAKKTDRTRNNAAEYLLKMAFEVCVEN